MALANVDQNCFLRRRRDVEAIERLRVNDSLGLDDARQRDEAAAATTANSRIKSVAGGALARQGVCKLKLRCALRRRRRR